MASRRTNPPQRQRKQHKTMSVPTDAAQKQALTLLANGYSVSKTATMVDRTRRTLVNWLQDPDFTKRLEKKKRKRIGKPTKNSEFRPYIDQYSELLAVLMEVSITWARNQLNSDKPDMPRVVQMLGRVMQKAPSLDAEMNAKTAQKLLESTAENQMKINLLPKKSEPIKDDVEDAEIIEN